MNDVCPARVQRGESPSPDAPTETPERRFQAEVERHLARNYAAHLAHGLLGQTGFRLLNAPTFLPAYVLMLSGGSNIAVGMALSAQALGTMLTPLIGANLIAHRTRVLPMGFLVGGAMRGSVLLIALTGLLLPPDWALPAIMVCLLLFGVFNGMQGVIFNTLMAKIIPVSRRGRLSGLRNFLAGITSSLVAGIGGIWLLGDAPTAWGYSMIFLVAFVLTAMGLATLAFMHEPEPPRVSPPASLRDRLGGLPTLLRSDPPFARYFVARSLATLGRMAVPFYIVHAGAGAHLDGSTLGILTMAFTLAGTISNLFWGQLADRRGFRLALLLSCGLWIAATVLLMAGSGLLLLTVVFAAIGAGVQGFQIASMNMTLEFGDREDLPLRIAIANTGSELAGAIGPLLGGLLAAALGYTAVFLTSIGFLAIGAVLILLFVPEPRRAGRG